MNTICEKCGADLEFYDHELMADTNERISIHFIGWCPCCKQNYIWTEEYKFVGTTIRKGISNNNDNKTDDNNEIRTIVETEPWRPSQFRLNP